MNHELSIPPLRDLPPGQIRARKQQLCALIAADTSESRRWPLRLAVARPRRTLLPIAAAFIAVGVAVGIGIRTNTSGATVLQGALTSKLGIRIELPSGWSGVIYNRQPSSASRAAFVHVGNFTLPSQDDDFGTNATARMRASSILIVLLETPRSGTKSGFRYPKLAKPLTISRGDFLALFQGVPPTHAFARRLFSVQGRRFMLWVQFGRKVPGSLLNEANTVLKTIRFSPSP